MDFKASSLNPHAAGQSVYHQVLTVSKALEFRGKAGRAQFLTSESFAFTSHQRTEVLWLVSSDPRSVFARHTALRPPALDSQCGQRGHHKDWGLPP